jgi:SAM-dependent methyltransferase
MSALPSGRDSNRPLEVTRVPVAERFARRFLKRKPLDDALDWVRFRIDTFPRKTWIFRNVTGAGYQHLPWVGLENGTRRGGIESRWEAMVPLLEELQPRSALDVGSNAGWFTLRLATSGIPTIAVDSDPKMFRTVLYAARKARAENVGVLVLRLEPASAELLPSADCVLLLSIWHHFVRHFGLVGATALLHSIWQRTSRVLFFDTGETEFHPGIGLPKMLPDASSWLSGYLSQNCAGAEVSHLGLHDAIAPDGSTYKRNLFALTRPGHRPPAA